MKFCRGFSSFRFVCQLY